MLPCSVGRQPADYRSVQPLLRPHTSPHPLSHCSPAQQQLFLLVGKPKRPQHNCGYDTAPQTSMVRCTAEVDAVAQDHNVNRVQEVISSSLCVNATLMQLPFQIATGQIIMAPECGADIPGRRHFGR